MRTSSTRPTFARTITFVLAALAAAGVAAVAGPMDPPAGAIQATGKPLAEIEPRIAINATNTPGDANSLYKITQPGSYYLTGNIQGVAGKSGINVTANGVTIDLGGFTVAGTGTLVGINAPGGSDLTVRNGVVTTWSTGLFTANGAHLSGVTARSNTGIGISVGSSATIESCTAASNGGDGFHAIYNCIIRNCVAESNGQDGFDVDGSTRVERCIAKANTAYGIYGAIQGVISNCTSDGNGAHGILALDQSTVEGCSSAGNGGAGIDASAGVLVSRCTVLSNNSHGIQCGAYCRIEGNYCRQNGNGAGTGAGIYLKVTATHALVSGNTCAGGDWGIKVDGTSAFLKGNTCTTNTINYEAVAGNRVATIITLVTSGAISGNSGGTSISDPDANFVY